MNIFRPKYRMMKERLKAFGERTKSEKSEVRYATAFWEERLDETKDLQSWDYVIAAYLAYWCTEEDRKFIDEAFFKNHSVKSVTMRTYMSESAYHSKKEEIMNYLLSFGMQEGLLSIGLINSQAEQEIACSFDSLIDDEVWKIIREMILKKIKRVTPTMRLSVEAMMYVIINAIPWREIPTRFGSWKTVYNKYLRWKKNGLWDEIYSVIETVLLK